MNLKPPFRVGFTLVDGKGWTGGYNYLLNLLNTLASEMPLVLVPILFVGQDVAEVDLQPFQIIPGCEVIRDSAFNSDIRSKVLLRSLIFGYDASVSRALYRANIDVVFEAAVYFGWRLHIPAIAWIPDLQHRFLPELFSQIAWIRRELGFRIQIWSDRSIMCSSLNTLREIERLYPSANKRVSAVRFAIKPPRTISDKDAREVADKYNLPPHYFFMPNQFWAHKNHRLVLKALQVLAENGRVCTIVACGQQLDPRDSGYVSQLLTDIKDAGLERYFITPGLLPYEDLAPLMQVSSAFINPSMFEGWSTTVEEAKSAGVPMILSDIPVHREQAGEAALYFNPKSPNALADILTTFFPLKDFQQKKERAFAKADSARRMKSFASEFYDVVQKSIKEDFSHKA